MTPAPSHRRALLLPCLIAALTGLLCFWLTARIGSLNLWPVETEALVGRAMLGTAGMADPSVLLAAYPPLPYLLLFAVGIFAEPLGLPLNAVVTALLTTGFIATFAGTLVRARYSQPMILFLVISLCLHPFAIQAVASGSETLILLWGVWLFGLGVFGTRVTGSVNSIAALGLSLPMLAFTSVYGAVIAMCAIPFLWLAVPPHMARRAFGSVYVVLLFPLVFAGLAMMIMSSILLHDPFGFIKDALLNEKPWNIQPRVAVAGFCAAAAMGCLIMTAALLARTGQRRPIQASAAALLGTSTLAAVIAGVLGLVPSVVDLLVPTVAASALTTTRWPVEGARTIRVIVLTIVALLFAFVFTISPGTQRYAPLVQAINGSAVPLSPDEALGRFLAAYQDVTIDALAHPVVVDTRGSTSGLVTSESSVFNTSMLARRIFTRSVAVPMHRPGMDDDAVVRNLPDLYAQGAPGYRLIYDHDGWRVWSIDVKDRP